MGIVDPTKATSGEALFRYTVVSQVRSAELAGQATSAAVRAVSLRVHQQGGVARRVSERSLYRWLALYKDTQELSSLEPTGPSDSNGTANRRKAFTFLNASDARTGRAGSVVLLAQGAARTRPRLDAPVERSSGPGVVRSALHRDADVGEGAHRRRCVRAGPQRVGRAQSRRCRWQCA